MASPIPSLQDAHALHSRGVWEEAERAYRSLLAIDPDNVDALHLLGVLRQQRGDPLDALALIDAAILRNDRVADFHGNRAEVLRRLGRLDEAEAACRRAFQLNPWAPTGPGPQHAEALRTLAAVLGARLAGQELAAIEKLSACDQVAPQVRSALHFALARVHDERDDYSEAARHADAANALKHQLLSKRGWRYTPARHARTVALTIQHFDPAFFQSPPPNPSAGARAAFLIGLPRSGKSLAEALLAGYPGVHAGGELALGSSVFDPTRGDGWKDRAGLMTAGAEIERRISTLAGSSALLTDTAPSNTGCLGVIGLLLPAAHIIYCRRHLRDLALACWMKNFGRIEWTCDPGYVSAYIREHERLIEHWRRVLPIPMHVLDYEEVVIDPVVSARQLAQWGGLESAAQPTPRAIAYSDDGRSEAIHDRHIGRWRRYVDHLPWLANVADSN